MDTNICLYCEKQLISTGSGLNSNSFCSRACHAKEAAKTHIPSWATPRGISSNRIQKAKAIASCTSGIRSPILLFNCSKYSSTSGSSSPTSSASMITTDTSTQSSPSFSSSISPPSPRIHHYHHHNHRSRSPRRQRLVISSPRNRSLSSPPDHINITNYYYRYSPTMATTDRVIQNNNHIPTTTHINTNDYTSDNNNCHEQP